MHVWLTLSLPLWPARGSGASQSQKYNFAVFICLRSVAATDATVSFLSLSLSSTYLFMVVNAAVVAIEAYNIMDHVVSLRNWTLSHDDENHPTHKHQKTEQKTKLNT